MAKQTKRILFVMDHPLELYAGLLANLGNKTVLVEFPFGYTVSRKSPCIFAFSRALSDEENAFLEDNAGNPFLCCIFTDEALASIRQRTIAKLNKDYTTILPQSDLVECKKALMIAIFLMSCTEMQSRDDDPSVWQTMMHTSNSLTALVLGLTPFLQTVCEQL